MIDELKQTMVSLRKQGVPPRYVHVIHKAIHHLQDLEKKLEEKKVD